MQTRRDDLTSGQRALRSAGLAAIALTAVLCGVVAYGYLSGAQGSGWGRVASAGGLAAAIVALVAMFADAFDLWMRGRRMTPFSLRMTRSLVFVAMLVAIVLNLVAHTPFFFPLMTPALMIYLFGAARRRPGPARRPAGGSTTRSSGPSRQRRGGRKRR